jgi:hypothetical protein
MSSRALILATVMLLVGCLAAERALAQATNLEAGKTPSQIFAGTCNACHKAPRGLLKTVPASSLSSFLRQHYTTSPEMAGVLASYLISNGASDTRLSGGDKKGAKEGTKEGTKEAKQEARPPEQLDRWGRRIHPGGAPVPEATPAASGESPQSPSQATIEAAREQNARQKLSKRNKPGEELPKTDGKGEGRSEGAKEASTPGETAMPEGSKPSEAPSQSANAAPSTPGESPASRPDPVPPVTPAPAAGSEPATASTPNSVISAAISAETAPAVPSPSKPVESPPAVVAATPALPPMPPAGPPAPPISR